jgi:hypothetical protein
MKAVRISSNGRTILRELASAGAGLLAFSIYRRYKLPIVAIVRELRLLQEKELVSLNGQRAELTEKGRAFVREIRLQLSATGTKSWRECPEEFKQPMWSPDKPFVPRIEMLDRKYFRISREILGEN